jgi:hypothetical protein
MSHLGDTVNRAAVYADPGTTKIELIELPIPEPGVGEILVRMYVQCSLSNMLL